jgi:NADH-quinone oxidoreductase E subunit
MNVSGESKTEPAKKVAFSDEGRKEVEELLRCYPDKRSAVIPVLHIAQREFGWISEPVMAYVAGLLDLTPPKVFEVLTFYTLFNQKPVGKYHLQVCRTLPCALAGGENLIRHLAKTLGIRPGETTPDGTFTLRTVECLASCGTAPMMQVNDAYYENLTAEGVDRLLEGFRNGKPAVPKAMGESGEEVNSKW